MRVGAVMLGVILVIGLPWGSRASCGWVLWEKVEQHSHMASKEEVASAWEFHTASETKDECEQSLTALWQLRREESQPRPERPEIEDVKATPGFLSVMYRGTDPHPAWAAYL